MFDTIVLGTRNLKKRRELEGLLSVRGIKVLTLDDFPASTEVVEDGLTFAANAAKKANEYALQTGHWVVCDDSGISVDALGGEPGIYSARFAGPAATDVDNLNLLLERLAGIPAEKRGAHYTCHIALADPSGTIRFQCEEICRGRVLENIHGEGGFGYDPVFQVLEYHLTFGQLGTAAKSMLSHRARAMRVFLHALQKGSF